MPEFSVLRWKKKAEFSFEQEFSGAELNVEHPLGFQSGFFFFFP